MRRRPLCRLCLLLLFILWFLCAAGILSPGENPLPLEVQQMISCRETSRIAGICGRITKTETGVKFLLYNSYILFHSKNKSIQNIMIYTTEEEGLLEGAFVVLSGKLTEFDPPGNPGEFNQKTYYACRHCYYRMTHAVLETGQEGGPSVSRVLSVIQGKASMVLDDIGGEEAPLLGAVFLGQKSEVAPDILERFRMAGFLHILSISGLHISILGMGFFTLLKKCCFRNESAALCSGGLVLAYGIMTGSSVSTLRALVMFLVWVAAKLLGRIYDLLSAMSLAFLLILMESPAYLYDSGFWMSFTAVVGIGGITPILRKGTGWKGRIGRSLLSSLGIFLGTLPVTLLVYGEYSVLGLLLNLLILPTVTAAVYSISGGILLGSFWRWGGKLLIWPGRLLMMGYERISRLPGYVPGSVWTPGAPDAWQVVLYYGVLGMLLFLAWSLERRSRERRKGETSLGRKRRRKKFHRIMSVSVIFGSILCVGILAVKIPKGLAITCLDVGQGDGIVIQTPEGQNFLIDGGSSDKQKVGTYQIIPYLRNQGIDRLDAIIVSHTDMDHISGIQELLEMMGERRVNLRVGMLLLPAWEKQNASYAKLQEAAEKAGIPVQKVYAGQSFRGKNLLIHILNPGKEGQTGDANEDSLVVEVNWRGYRALFPGDGGETTEMRMKEEKVLEDVDFLKVGHHGSRYSSTEAFLQEISPEIGVISCGKDNSYGHPHVETLERLKQNNTAAYCTMEMGAVTVTVRDRRGEKVVNVKGYR
ncbi:MAG: DNA internalization-related competence protein ComEC/Rec2 [Eubacteriales bacterium]|nr:DNA internalization-related competence protein ComEC/Rec2 [Eubacteriales bacterium]